MPAGPLQRQPSARAVADETGPAGRVLRALQAWRRPTRVGDRLAGARVLVVDDFRLYREAVVEALGSAVGTVAEASNGWEALDELQTGEFDVVLMDLHMPLMDGYTAIARIREQPRHQALPILAWSDDLGANHREHCLRIGASDLLSKAIEPQVLRQSVANHLPARA